MGLVDGEIGNKKLSRAKACNNVFVRIFVGLGSKGFCGK